MASKIGKSGWIGLYVVSGVMDVVQFFLGVLGWLLSETVVALVLIAINDYADPFIGVALLGFFELRGVSMIRHWQRGLSLLGVAGLDELTGGVASFWIVDVWYIHNTVKKEEMELQAQREQTMTITAGNRQPANRGGIRQPNTQTTASMSSTRTYNLAPLNKDGVRPPTATVVGPSTSKTTFTNAAKQGSPDKKILV